MLWQLQSYSCRRCGCGFTCHPHTLEVLGGRCWACVYVDSLPASAQDFMLNWYEQEIEGMELDS